MKYFTILLFLAVLCPCTNAQKIGHVNYGNLLESLPQVKVADEVLTSYQDSITAAFESRVQAHQQRVTDNQTRYKAGEMTKVEAESLNKTLNQEQAVLAEEQQQIERSILQRRQQMLQPIIERINAIITAYGKQNGYSFIFDESVGFLLFDQPEEDLTEIISKIASE
jgi:outer membrane protein